MQAKTQTIYESEDGNIFTTADECIDYETKAFFLKMLKQFNDEEYPQSANILKKTNLELATFIASKRTEIYNFLEARDVYKDQKPKLGLKLED